MKTWRAAAPVWTIAILFASCEDPDDVLPVSIVGPDGDPVATTLRTLSGDGQTGLVGQSLEDPLVVEVRDQNDDPMAGVAITWTAGPGSDFTAIDHFTGTDGRAEATWKMGEQAGVYTATAAASPGTTIFSGSAMPEGPYRAEVVSGDAQSAQAGSSPSDPLVVQIFDRFDNVVSGAVVTWNGSHSGTASPPTVATGDDGTASTVWTLGCQPVVQTMTASAGPASADFSGSAETGSPEELIKVSGDNQEGLFGAWLEEDIVVRVEDDCGNPVEGVTVTFEITSQKGGIVSAPNAVTDASGQASTGWRLGFGVGEHTLKAEVDLSGTLLTAFFTAIGIN